MDLNLSTECRELQEAAADFARRELDHDMIDADAERRFSRAAWQKCADFGIQGLPVPEAYGGGDADLTTTIAVMEGLGYGCRDQGLLFSINTHLWANTIPILRHGTEGLKKRLLPRLCSGDLIGANAASEPDAGSDILSMRARVERQGDDYILNGTKIFVTNAPVCGIITAYATLDQGRGATDICGFIVERDMPGVRVGPAIDKMGLHTSPMAEVSFENVRVPAAGRLGAEGQGVEVLNSAMEWERGSILACCLGVMRRQLEQCVRYARQREQFGRPIGQFQAVANRIVDMKIRQETARDLVYRLARTKQAGHDADLEAAMAKIYASECFVQSSLDAIRVHGGYGYMTESRLECDFRDAVGSTLYSGTNDIQRNVIARSLGL